MNTNIDYELLLSIKNNIAELKSLLNKANEHWYFEDAFYRLYHHSFKVYYIQDFTLTIINKFKEIFPNKELNSEFMKIVNDGIGKKFNIEDNKNWLNATRPIIEAFFHAKYFLELMIKYGEELQQAPNSLPSGWAAILYLYGIR